MKQITETWIPCKPTDSRMLITRYIPEYENSIQFRSLNLKTDLPAIHDWLQQDYTQAYWQMKGSLHMLASCYQCILTNPNAHSFVGFLGNELICQLDVYRSSADELNQFYSFNNNDCGFHLLMAPNKMRLPGLTTNAVKTFLEYYFSFEETDSLYGEPDKTNERSILLLERLGFERICEIRLSYKDAYLYHLPKVSS